MIADPSAAHIARAAQLLSAGELVGIPTETVYGLAADARSAQAVQKIFRLKGRPAHNPLIVHIAHRGLLETVARIEGDAALQRRIERLAPLWPGPLTVVLPKAAAVPDIVTAGGTTVALRIPAHPVAQALLQAFGGPVAAPSANKSGSLSPTTAQHVAADFGDALPLILDGGACRVGIESTVVSINGDAPRLLRPGIISREQLETVLGEEILPYGQTALEDETSSTPLPSPGMLSAHYAPRTPLRLWSSGDPLPEGPALGVVFFSRIPAAFAADRATAVRLLAPSGTLEEAAERLYALLHELDDLGLRHIVVELPQGAGVAEALRDRLRRAAHGSN